MEEIDFISVYLGWFFFLANILLFVGMFGLGLSGRMLIRLFNTITPQKSARTRKSSEVKNQLLQRGFFFLHNRFRKFQHDIAFIFGDLPDIGNTFLRQFDSITTLPLIEKTVYPGFFTGNCQGELLRLRFIISFDNLEISIFGST
jgi:hypothetical protein